MIARSEIAGTVVKLNLGDIGFMVTAGAGCTLLAIVQTLLGGELIPSILLSGAAFFGLLAVNVAGATSAVGLLNLILVGRVLLGAFAAKNLLLEQPITADMLDPLSTAETMFLGFIGVWLGTLITNHMVKPIPLFGLQSDPQHLRALLAVMLVATVVSSVAVRFTGGDGEVLAGGAWGIAKALTSTRNLSLPILMLYLARTGSKRWLTHPAVIALALFLFVIGVLSNSKQSMAEPVVFYILMAIARYGWRHPVGWVVVPIGLVLFQFFIYPISQYARNAGGTTKNPIEAAIATGGIVGDYLTNASFREYVRGQATSGGHWDDGTAYLPPKLVAVGRFALVGEADRLVSASNVYQLTEWDTITNSLLLAVPHFLYPNKPQEGSGNYLARYTGDLPSTDVSTQVSYGFMANSYNAFGIGWVFPLSLLTVLLVLIPVSLISHGKAYENPWSMFALVSLHQAYAESSFSGLFGAFQMPILAAALLATALAFLWIQGRSQTTVLTREGTSLPAVDSKSLTDFTRP